MNDTDVDVREVPRGAQVTFEVRSHTVIGTVGDYLGDGEYIVTDEDDNDHEMHISQLELVDED